MPDGVGAPHLVRLLLEIDGSEKEIRVRGTALNSELTCSAGDPPLDELVILGSDWYWEQDADFRFTHVACPLGRQLPCEFKIGQCRWDIPGALPLTASWEEHRARLLAREPFSGFEYVTFPPDRTSPRYISVTGVPRFTPDGEFAGYRGNTRDITDQWVSRHKLAEAEGLLKLAASLGRFGAWSVDLATGRVTWSDELRAMRRLAPSYEVTMDRTLELYAPEHRTSMSRAFDACAQQGRPFDVEAQVILPERGLIWARVIGVPHRDASGKIVRVQGAFQDIDSSKSATDRLRTDAQRYRRTLDGLTDGFAIMDRDWRITYANPNALAAFGFVAEQVIGESYWDLFPDARGTAFEENYRRAMECGQDARFEAEYGPLGMWFRVSVFPFEDGIAISFADITETRLAQEALLQLNAQLEDRVRRRTCELEQALKNLESFSYTIAHDLRSPLSAIRGFSQALAESTEQQLGPRSGHYLERVCHAARQMDEMTDAILALARLSRCELRAELVDIGWLASECLANLSARDPHRRVRQQVMPCLWASCDPTLMRIVVQNIVENAWKYTSAVAQPSIEIGTELIDGVELCYYVQDNGEGFDPAERDRIFQPFYRIRHQSDGHIGSGIGLATVQRIVERHGGRVWANAIPGCGARISFTLGDRSKGA